jgi:hypothetical protein
LAALARRLNVAEEDAAANTGATPVLEFHCQAGAPEGALFADGKLVGFIEGVTRL